MADSQPSSHKETTSIGGKFNKTKNESSRRKQDTAHTGKDTSQAAPLNKTDDDDDDDDDEDDDNLLSVNISMLQQHAHCA